MKSESNRLPAELREAAKAAIEKKALDLAVLELKDVTAFTDYFLICTGTSNRQMQAICDEIERRLSLRGLRPLHREGYNHAEWILLDYMDFVVHIFSERSRSFYGLERLWRTARRIPAEGKSE